MDNEIVEARIQRLSKEYDEVCEAEGSDSEKAARIADQIDHWMSMKARYFKEPELIEKATPGKLETFLTVALPIIDVGGKILAAVLVPVAMEKMKESHHTKMMHECWQYELDGRVLSKAGQIEVGQALKL